MLGNGSCLYRVFHHAIAAPPCRKRSLSTPQIKLRTPSDINNHSITFTKNFCWDVIQRGVSFDLCNCIAKLKGGTYTCWSLLLPNSSLTHQSTVNTSTGKKFPSILSLSFQAQIRTLNPEHSGERPGGRRILNHECIGEGNRSMTWRGTEDKTWTAYKE